MFKRYKGSPKSYKWASGNVRYVWHLLMQSSHRLVQIDERLYRRFKYRQGKLHKTFSYRVHLKTITNIWIEFPAECFIANYDKIGYAFMSVK